MIGKLRGIVDAIYEDHIIIDVQGVGYLVHCGSKILRNVIVGKSAQLFIETHVREDHIKLYGFANSVEKYSFNILQSVKGVGARMALAILSSLSPAEIQVVVSQKDKASLWAVPGVGKKLAERLITELQDKFTTDIWLHQPLAFSTEMGGGEDDSTGAGNNSSSNMSGKNRSSIDENGSMPGKGDLKDGDAAIEEYEKPVDQSAEICQQISKFKNAANGGAKRCDKGSGALKGKSRAKSTGELNDRATAAAEASNIIVMSQDAISALTNLGISRIEAHQRVHNIMANNKDISISELIKLALRHAE